MSDNTRREAASEYTKAAVAYCEIRDRRANSENCEKEMNSAWLVWERAAANARKETV